MVASLDGESTKTSARWSRRPGNFDLLNLKVLFDGDADGIPSLRRDDFKPAGLVPYNFTREMERRRRDGDTVHFFLDDYRFEACWTTPQRALSRVALFGQALAPDFSVLTTMPRVMQAWQVYRARWVGAYWQSHGVRVIPTATWSTPDTYELCWAGLPRGGAVAVSAVGIGRSQEKVGEGSSTREKGPLLEKGSSTGGWSTPRDLFRAGLRAMVAHLEPARLIVYGGFGDLAQGMDLPSVVAYPTLHEQRGWRHRTRTA